MSENTMDKYIITHIRMLAIYQLFINKCLDLGLAQNRGWQLYVSQIWPRVCFCVAHKLRMIFTFLKGSLKKHKEDHETEILHDMQSLKYLLLGSLQKSLPTLGLTGVSWVT